MVLQINLYVELVTYLTSPKTTLCQLLFRQLSCCPSKIDEHKGRSFNTLDHIAQVNRLGMMEPLCPCRCGDWWLRILGCPTWVVVHATCWNTIWHRTQGVASRKWQCNHSLCMRESVTQHEGPLYMLSLSQHDKVLCTSWQSDMRQRFFKYAGQPSWSLREHTLLWVIHHPFPPSSSKASSGQRQKDECQSSIRCLITINMTLSTCACDWACVSVVCASWQHVKRICKWLAAIDVAYEWFCRVMKVSMHQCYTSSCPIRIFSCTINCHVAPV